MTQEMICFRIGMGMIKDIPCMNGQRWIVATNSPAQIVNHEYKEYPRLLPYLYWNTEGVPKNFEINFCV